MSSEMDFRGPSWQPRPFRGRGRFLWSPWWFTAKCWEARPLACLLFCQNLAPPPSPAMPGELEWVLLLLCCIRVCVCGSWWTGGPRLRAGCPAPGSEPAACLDVLLCSPCPAGRQTSTFAERFYMRLSHVFQKGVIIKMISFTSSTESCSEWKGTPEERELPQVTWPLVAGASAAWRFDVGDGSQHWKRRDSHSLSKSHSLLELCEPLSPSFWFLASSAPHPWLTWSGTDSLPPLLNHL